MASFKRYHSTDKPGIMRKDNTLIGYPKKDLRINTYLGEVTYDLMAVVKHYGDHTGGHYVACTLDPVDKNWYNISDTQIKGPLEDDFEIVTKYAYVLFYRKVEAEGE